MNQINLDEIAKRLADEIRESLSSSKPSLFTQLLHLIAKRKPVSLEKIATALRISRDEITAALGLMPSMAFAASPPC